MHDDDDKAQREQGAAEALAEGRRIASVYLWQNGLVMVFDQYGEQMPAYQGRYIDVRALILRDAPAGAKFTGGTWREPSTWQPIEF